MRSSRAHATSRASVPFELSYLAPGLWRGYLPASSLPKHLGITACLLTGLGPAGPQSLRQGQIPASQTLLVWQMDTQTTFSPQRTAGWSLQLGLDGKGILTAGTGMSWRSRPKGHQLGTGWVPSRVEPLLCSHQPQDYQLPGTHTWYQPPPSPP